MRAIADQKDALSDGTAAAMVHSKQGEGSERTDARPHSSEAEARLQKLRRESAAIAASGSSSPSRLGVLNAENGKKYLYDILTIKKETSKPQQ